MTMVYLSSVVSEGVGSPRGKPGALVVARAGGITWSTKPIIIKNAPRTIWYPTDRQAAVRYVFGMTAINTQGITGKAALHYDGRKVPKGTIVPRPAAVIQAYLKGKVKDLVSESAFPKQTGRGAYHVHGVGTLYSMLGDKAKNLPTIAKEAVLAAARNAGVL